MADQVGVERGVPHQFVVRADPRAGAVEQQDADRAPTAISPHTVSIVVSPGASRMT
ncbi:hypothetical protein [Acrocarpospora pleiomorpha]|uniref:hypothetical protein n=1 Tax=Acrocarpospora pleiomorpha TaxID=90975 RepID=UPI0012D2D4CE|nr:hypothetical protein [Acrocarpospora pleiomorpha]